MVPPVETKVLKEKLLKYLNCPLCGRLCQKATTIVECLHTFCHTCILEKLEDGRENFCPECNVSLGHRPFEALRFDRQLADIRLKLFPQENAAERLEPDKVQSGEEAAASRRRKPLGPQLADLRNQYDALANKLQASKVQVAKLEASLSEERRLRQASEDSAAAQEQIWNKACAIFHRLAAKHRRGCQAMDEFARFAERMRVALETARKGSEVVTAKDGAVMDMLLKEWERQDSPLKGWKEWQKMTKKMSAVLEGIVGEFVALEQKQQECRIMEQEEKQGREAAARKRIQRAVAVAEGEIEGEARRVRIAGIKARPGIQADKVNALDGPIGSRMGVEKGLDDSRLSTKWASVKQRKNRELESLKPPGFRNGSKLSDVEGMLHVPRSTKKATVCVSPQETLTVNANTGSTTLNRNPNQDSLALQPDLHPNIQASQYLEGIMDMDVEPIVDSRSFAARQVPTQLKRKRGSDDLESVPLVRKEVDPYCIEEDDYEQQAVDISRSGEEVATAEVPVEYELMDRRDCTWGLKRLSGRKPRRHPEQCGDRGAENDSFEAETGGPGQSIQVETGERRMLEHGTMGFLEQGADKEEVEEELQGEKEKDERASVSELGGPDEVANGQQQRRTPATGHAVGDERKAAQSVLKNSNGEGPPHVPEGWGWRVGSRSRGGYWCDRYMWPPGAPRAYRHALRSENDMLRYFQGLYPTETAAQIESRKAEFERQWPWRLRVKNSGEQDDERFQEVQEECTLADSMPGRREEGSQGDVTGQPGKERESKEGNCTGGKGDDGDQEFMNGFRQDIEDSEGISKEGDSLGDEGKGNRKESGVEHGRRWASIEEEGRAGERTQCFQQFAAEAVVEAQRSYVAVARERSGSRDARQLGQPGAIAVVAEKGSGSHWRGSGQGQDARLGADVSADGRTCQMQPPESGHSAALRGAVAENVETGAEAGAGMEANGHGRRQEMGLGPGRREMSQLQNTSQRQADSEGMDMAANVQTRTVQASVTVPEQSEATVVSINKGTDKPSPSSGECAAEKIRAAAGERITRVLPTGEVRGAEEATEGVATVDCTFQGEVRRVPVAYWIESLMASPVSQSADAVAASHRNALTPEFASGQNGSAAWKPQGMGNHLRVLEQSISVPLTFTRTHTPSSMGEKGSIELVDVKVHLAYSSPKQLSRQLALRPDIEPLGEVAAHGRSKVSDGEAALTFGEIPLSGTGSDILHSQSPLGQVMSSDRPEGGHVACSDRVEGGPVPFSDRREGGQVASSDRLEGGQLASLDRLKGGQVACSDRLEGGQVAYLYRLGGGQVASSGSREGGHVASSDKLEGGQAADRLEGGQVASSDRLEGGQVANGLEGGQVASSDSREGGHVASSDKLEGGQVVDRLEGEQVASSDRRDGGPVASSDKLEGGQVADRLEGGQVASSDRCDGGPVASSDKLEGGQVASSDRRDGGPVASADKVEGGQVASSDRRDGGPVASADKLEGGQVASSDRRDGGPVASSDRFGKQMTLPALSEGPLQMSACVKSEIAELITPSVGLELVDRKSEAGQMSLFEGLRPVSKVGLSEKPAVFKAAWTSDKPEPIRQVSAPEGSITDTEQVDRTDEGRNGEDAPMASTDTGAENQGGACLSQNQGVVMTGDYSVKTRGVDDSPFSDAEGHRSVLLNAGIGAAARSKEEKALGRVGYLSNCMQRPDLNLDPIASPSGESGAPDRDEVLSTSEEAEEAELTELGQEEKSPTMTRKAALRGHSWQPLGCSEVESQNQMGRENIVEGSKEHVDGEDESLAQARRLLKNRSELLHALNQGLSLADQVQECVVNHTLPDGALLPGSTAGHRASPGPSHVPHGPELTTQMNPLTLDESREVCAAPDMAKPSGLPNGDAGVWRPSFQFHPDTASRPVLDLFQTTAAAPSSQTATPATNSEGVAHLFQSRSSVALAQTSLAVEDSGPAPNPPTTSSPALGFLSNAATPSIPAGPLLPLTDSAAVSLSRRANRLLSLFQAEGLAVQSNASSSKESTPVTDDLQTTESIALGLNGTSGAHSLSVADQLLTTGSGASSQPNTAAMDSPLILTLLQAQGWAARGADNGSAVSDSRLNLNLLQNLGSAGLGFSTDAIEGPTSLRSLLQVLGLTDLSLSNAAATSSLPDPHMAQTANGPARGLSSLAATEPRPVPNLPEATGLGALGLPSSSVTVKDLYQNLFTGQCSGPLSSSTHPLALSNSAVQPVLASSEILTPPHYVAAPSHLTNGACPGSASGEQSPAGSSHRAPSLPQEPSEARPELAASSIAHAPLPPAGPTFTMGPFPSGSAPFQAKQAPAHSSLFPFHATNAAHHPSSGPMNRVSGSGPMSFPVPPSSGPFSATTSTPSAPACSSFSPSTAAARGAAQASILNLCNALPHADTVHRDFTPANHREAHVLPLASTVATARLGPPSWASPGAPCSRTAVPLWAAGAGGLSIGDLARQTMAASLPPGSKSAWPGAPDPAEATQGSGSSCPAGSRSAASPAPASSSSTGDFSREGQASVTLPASNCFARMQPKPGLQGMISEQVALSLSTGESSEGCRTLLVGVPSTGDGPKRPRLPPLAKGPQGRDSESKRLTKVKRTKRHKTDWWGVGGNSPEAATLEGGSGLGPGSEGDGSRQASGEVSGRSNGARAAAALQEEGSMGFRPLAESEEGSGVGPMYSRRRVVNKVELEVEGERIVWDPCTGYVKQASLLKGKKRMAELIALVGRLANSLEEDCGAQEFPGLPLVEELDVPLIPSGGDEAGGDPECGGRAPPPLRRAGSYLSVAFVRPDIVPRLVQGLYGMEHRGFGEAVRSACMPALRAHFEYFTCMMVNGPGPAPLPLPSQASVVKDYTALSIASLDLASLKLKSGRIVTYCQTTGLFWAGSMGERLAASYVKNRVEIGRLVTAGKHWLGKGLPVLEVVRPGGVWANSQSGVVMAPWLVPHFMANQVDAQEICQHLRPVFAAYAVHVKRLVEKGRKSTGEQEDGAEAEGMDGAGSEEGGIERGDGTDKGEGNQGEATTGGQSDAGNQHQPSVLELEPATKQRLHRLREEAKILVSIQWDLPHLSQLASFCRHLYAPQQQTQPQVFGDTFPFRLLGCQPILNQPISSLQGQHPVRCTRPAQQSLSQDWKTACVNKVEGLTRAEMGTTGPGGGSCQGVAGQPTVDAFDRERGELEQVLHRLVALEVLAAVEADLEAHGIVETRLTRRLFYSVKEAGERILAWRHGKLVVGIADVAGFYGLTTEQARARITKWVYSKSLGAREGVDYKMDCPPSCSDAASPRAAGEGADERGDNDLFAVGANGPGRPPPSITVVLTADFFVKRVAKRLHSQEAHALFENACLWVELQSPSEENLKSLTRLRHIVKAARCAGVGDVAAFYPYSCKQSALVRVRRIMGEAELAEYEVGDGHIYEFPLHIFDRIMSGSRYYQIARGIVDEVL